MGQLTFQWTAAGEGAVAEAPLPDLEFLYQCLNEEYFRGALPPCRLVWNPRLRTTAGLVDVRRRLIELSPSYHRSFGKNEVRDTLLHEMIHIDQARRRVTVGHNPEMKRMARRFGLRSIFSKDLPGRPPPRYVYRCPACGRRVMRRIRIGRSRNACMECCNRWNGGRWDPRFALVLEDDSRGD